MNIDVFLTRDVTIQKSLHLRTNYIVYCFMNHYLLKVEIGTVAFVTEISLLVYNNLRNKRAFINDLV